MTEVLIARLKRDIEAITGARMRVFDIFIISGWMWLGIFLVARTFA
jgi:hypothetical protein